MVQARYATIKTKQLVPREEVDFFSRESQCFREQSQLHKPIEAQNI